MIFKNIKKIIFPIPIWGLCVFFIITVITTLLFGNIQNDLTSTIASTVIGLLSGAIASIITAIMLEYSKSKRIERLVEEDLKNLKIWLDDLFQEISSLLLTEDLQECMNFKSVFQKFVKQMESATKINAMDNKNLGIYVYMQLIISTIDKLMTGEEKAYIFTKYDDASLFLILSRSIFNLGENLFNNGNYSYEYIYTGIYDFLSTIPQYADLLEKEYHTNNK